MPASAMAANTSVTECCFRNTVDRMIRPASVKAAAAYVTDSAEHDGVVTGLEHFGLI